MGAQFAAEIQAESSVEIPLKIILPARSQVKTPKRKAESRKVRKASSSAGSSAKSTAPLPSKKTSATASVKKVTLKAKAGGRRTKGASPSGASDSPSQVSRHARRAKAAKPDFDHFANSVMFSASEAGEKQGMDGGDKENSGESTSESPVPPPRRRGRPPKSKASDLPEITEYSVSVYLEIERPPSKKSSRKATEQENWLGGPVTVTRGTTWPAFLRDVARAVKAEAEHLAMNSLKWTTMADPTAPPKARAVTQWLPMTNEVGFAAFVSNGILATRGSRTFLVKMNPPEKAVCPGSVQDLRGELMLSNVQPWDMTDRGEGADGELELGDSSDDQPSKKKAKKAAVRPSI